MSCPHTRYDRPDINHILWNRETKGNNQTEKQKQRRQIEREEEKNERKIEETNCCRAPPPAREVALSHIIYYRLGVDVLSEMWKNNSFPRRIKPVPCARSEGLPQSQQKQSCGFSEQLYKIDSRIDIFCCCCWWCGGGGGGFFFPPIPLVIFALFCRSCSLLVVNQIQDMKKGSSPPSPPRCVPRFLSSSIYSRRCCAYPRYNGLSLDSYIQQ